MSLLRQIQDAAIDSSTPISDLLRRCAILANRLGNAEFKQWVDFELNGYPPSAALPDYRILPAPAIGDFEGAYGSWLRNIGIPPSSLPNEYRQYAERVLLRQPISFCAAMAQTDPSGSVNAPWPADLLVIVGRKIVSDMQLMGASQPISHASLVGIVDIVRNRVLEFAMQIEGVSPQAGEIDASPVVSPERVGQLYQTIIVGNVSNLAHGSPGAVQTSIVIQPGDLAALQRYLADLGVGGDDIKELETTLAAEKDAQGLGPKTTGWLAKLASKGVGVAGKVGGGVATGLINKAILQYLGIG